MTKSNLVILVHGMGTYDTGQITKEVEGGLNNALGFCGLDFDYKKDIEFVEHNYGIELDRIRKAEAETLADFKELDINNNIVGMLKKYAANVGGDKFFYTHILDVIYYGLTMWGERLRVSFAKDLIEKMKRATLNGQRVHVLSYSLGAALVNDTFSKIYRDGETSDEFLSIHDHKVDHYWAISNVSRILHELNGIHDANPKTNVVHDGLAGCTNKMTVVSHKYDPFMLIKKYRREPEKGRFQEPSGITQLNTHDLTGYLSDPDVGAKMLYDLYGGETGLNMENLTAGIDRYKATTLNGQIDGLQDKWAKVVSSTSNPVGAVENVESLITAAKEFRDRLDAFIPKKSTPNSPEQGTGA
jgi:hypothetical protein